MININTMEKLFEMYDPDCCDTTKHNIVRRMVSIFLLKSSKDNSLGFSIPIADDEKLDYIVPELHCLYDENPIFEKAIECLFEHYGWSEESDLCYSFTDDCATQYPKWFVKYIINFLESECLMDYTLDEEDEALLEGDENDTMCFSDFTCYDIDTCFNLKTLYNTKLDAILSSATGEQREKIIKQVKGQYGFFRFFICYSHEDTLQHDGHFYFISLLDPICDSWGTTYETDVERYYDFDLFQTLPEFDQFLNSISQELSI